MKKLLLLVLFFSFLNASNLQKTSIQLMWLDQFEFAGFYMAKEKGFYQDVGLDVELKKFDSSIDLTQKVLDKESDFGLNSSSLIIDKAKGKDVVLLGTIFQSSPLILLSLKDSNINNFADLKNKKIMVSNNQENFAPLQSMLKSQGLQIQELNLISHTFNVDDLINKKTDLMSAYITNEPFVLNEKGYEVNIFNPKDYGFNFYENILFTSKEFASKNPKLVKDFYNATMKGWKYTFDNIDETAKLIHEKYNSQNKSLNALIFEANEMKKLVYDKNGKFGTISQEKINLILNTYRVMGLINNSLELDDLIYTKHLENNMLLNDNEKEYLKKKKIITMCVDPSRMPFEKIENGKHIGIIADYINLIQNKIKTPIVLIPTKTWDESLQKAENRECDILSFAVNSLGRQEYLNFTKPFFNLPLVIASDIHTPFIEDIGKIKNQKFGIVKGYAYETVLKVKYPNLKLVQVENIEKGLQLVKKGQIFGFIDNLATVGYYIQNDYIGQLKISGKFNEIWDLGIGTRSDEAILNTIFEKVTNDISNNNLQQITNKWIPIEYQEEFDYKLLYQILAVILILTFIGIIFYRDYLLKKLNTQLNEKIKIEIEKNEEKNRILIQQSRMASMGEMLENIAHQWRQPLSTISVAASGMEIKKEFSSLSDKEFFEAIDHIKKSTQYLSNTIDDFRSFFSKNKKTSQINISDTIEKSLELMGNSFLHHKINLVKNIKSIEILSLENELIQVLMNILVNAKDALRHTVSADKYIFIDVIKKENQIFIQIKDNAGGINDDIIDKIFEPYFTTKHQFNGTGIGLYMSKLLMEKHLKGELTVKNVEYTFMDNTYKGALFQVILPIS
jgi:ABC-type nitrate/sulfonate/bicarbonate transport system substrate-binding protein/signal transduction histidine kinase